VLRRLDVFLCRLGLILVEQQDCGVNRGVWIMQLLVRQFLQNFYSFRGASQSVKRKRVGDCAVHVLWRFIVSLLGKTMTFGGVVLDEQAEARVTGRGTDFVR
jgi:hypothetical protein